MNNPLSSADISAIAERLQRGLGAAFQVQERIGGGAFGDVFAVRDLFLQRDVAIKVLRHISDEALHRFEREARILGNLKHPGIVPVHFVGVAEGLAFMVMPRVAGPSLRAVIEQGEIPIQEVRGITLEIASALDAAHKSGILHRDIKPENIMLEGPDRRVQVLDFGIAKRLDTDLPLPSITGEDPIVIGTEAYMSPEQWTGDRAIDARSDVYALGCVAYEMLAGRVPFTADTPSTVAAQHLTRAPASIRKSRPGVSSRLEKHVLRALAKSPAERFASAGAFADAVAADALNVSRPWWRFWGG